MKKARVLLLTALCLPITACMALNPLDTVGPGPGQFAGTVVGGIAGGLLGSTVGHGPGRLAATLGGATAGAVVGGYVGRLLDGTDRDVAHDAAKSALETGREMTWSNKESGHRGTIVPGKTYRRADGRLCRDFTHSIELESENDLVHGRACQDKHGDWHIVG